MALGSSSRLIISRCPLLGGYNAPGTSRQQRLTSCLQRPIWLMHSSRTFSTDENAPFDHHTKYKQRQRAAFNAKTYYEAHLASSSQQPPPPIPYDYFHAEIANRLIDRLDDILTPDNRGFPLALEIGSSGGDFVYNAICSGYEDDLELDPESNTDNESQGGRGGVRKLVQVDQCQDMLHRDEAVRQTLPAASQCETYKLVTDYEIYPWSFPDGTFDLVVSSMAFHWVNDLPKLLMEIKRVLKPDGCLLFALPGGNTLPELRSSLVLAELERTGGVSTHLGPYIDVSNIGGLLTGTGFKLPTVDVDEISIGYPNMMVLMEHLGRMGEGNACKARKDRVGIGTFLGAAAVYRELYPEEDEGVVASAQVIYGIAWKEHESQQKPLERGSATKKMTEITVTKTNNGEV